MQGPENLEVVVTFRRNGRQVAQMTLSSSMASAIFGDMPQAPHEVGPGISLAHALAASGAPMSVTQELARHTDPRLTQAVYVDANLLPLKQALSALVAAGYEKGGTILKDECLHSAAKADTVVQPQAMHPTPNNPENTAPASETLARRPVVRSTPGDLAGADVSGNTCGGLSPEQAGKWARQGSNLPRSARAILIAAADLLRATASALEAHDEQREEGRE